MNSQNRLSYESYIHLIQQLDQLVSHLEQESNPQAREQVMALLSGLDILHREGLKRLVDRLHAAGAEEALRQATEDPVVEILLGLYDLVELDLPAEPPPSFIPLEEITVSRRQNNSATEHAPVNLEFDGASSSRCASEDSASSSRCASEDSASSSRCASEDGDG